MKRIIFSLFVVILAAFTTYANSGGKINISGTEFFDPFGLIGAPVGQFLEAGTVKCPGHEPTGNPELPCPAGSRTHTRGTIWMSRYVASDPRFTGWFTIEGNGNFDADFTGSQWGKYKLVFDAGGEMTGSFQGVRYKEGNVWITPLHATGHVSGGDFDGANAIVSNRIVGFTPIPVLYVGYIERTLVRVP